MMDIHSHIKREGNTYFIDELLQDMDRFQVDKRVISDMRVDNIQYGNQAVIDLVQQHPDRLIGCALLNPSLSTIMEDVRHACASAEIQMVEFNSYEHGYAPDNCPILDEVFEILNQAHMPVKVFSGIGAKALPHQWELYTKKYPELPFIFLHMGCFDYGYSCVDIVKRNPNAYIETSNQYEMQILRKAFQQLPKEKILFGTSYPERFTRNAIEIFDLFDLDAQTRQAYFHDNALALLQR